MLTRVYGTAFPSKEELAAYLEALELARQRDHRRIGRDLDLFSFHEEGPGFPFFHPKGMRLWNAMIDYWRAEHVRAGYEEISTPVILRRELWERSGHWDNYKENMYFTEIDEQPYAVKPMNCPGGLLIYKSRRRSYRDLPLRMAELGRVHRHEMSGVLHGLFRVRYFTQDDAHIYCTPEQLEDEVLGVLRFMLHIYAAFGFSDVHDRAVHPAGEEHRHRRDVGARRGCACATRSRPTASSTCSTPATAPSTAPRSTSTSATSWAAPGSAAPSRSTSPCPRRLDITYTGADNEEHRPVMIHRALLGSIERFMGILLEHYGGNLPTWLAPEQVLVLPIADRHADYAREVLVALRAAGAEASVILHADVDDRGESVGKRIRDAQLQKVPYILVVGDREVEQGAVGVRERGEDKGARPLAEFVDDLVAEVRERAAAPAS